MRRAFPVITIVGFAIWTGVWTVLALAHAAFDDKSAPGYYPALVILVLLAAGYWRQFYAMLAERRVR